MAVVEVTVSAIHALVKRGETGDIKAMREAEDILMRALEKKPDDFVVMWYLANVFLKTERYQLAIALLHRVLQLNPQIHDVHHNLGMAYRASYVNDKAVHHMETYRNIRPEDPDIYNNLGTLHINEGEPEKALEYLDKGLEFDSTHNQLHWNRGLALLEQQRWGEGFDEYTWGLNSNDRLVKNYGSAVWWDGKPHPDSTLVIYGEQGIGDEIMFASILPDAVRKFGGRVVFDCHPRLYELFKLSLGDLVYCYPTRKVLQTEPEWVKKEKPQYKLAIGNLGRFFRRNEPDWPKLAYLKADPEKVAEYEEWLTHLPQRVPIGLSWVGGHKRTRKDMRALPLAELLPLFNEVDATYISFQYTPHGSADSELLYDKYDVEVFHFPEVMEAGKWERYIVKQNGQVVGIFGDKGSAKAMMSMGGDNLSLEHIPGPAYDYMEVAAFAQAIVNCGGCIVTVNTSLVHLCGAMGLPTFVLTPKRVAWRYGTSRTDMAMYPDTLRQFRQTGDDWKEAVEEMTKAVREYIQC